MRTTRLHPVAAAVGLVVAVAVGGWLLAPQVVGGPMAYLVVRGSSMAPTFGPGDLVVVRHDPPYEPGEVVAYRTPGDGRAPDDEDGAPPVIVHRVVAVEDGRLVLRGDANDVDDAIRPRPDDILGRQVAVLPGVGDVLAGVRTYAIVLAVAVAAVLGWSAMTRPPRRRRSPDAPSTATAVTTPAEGSDPLDSLAVRRPGPPWVWAVLAVGVSLAAVVVAQTPGTTEVATSVPWTVRTSFGWDTPPTGDPIAVAVYGDDGLRTGDTVFLSATPVLNMQLASTLSAGSSPASPAAPPAAPSPAPGAAPAGSFDPVGGDGSDQFGGTFAAEAAVVSDAGWRRSVATLAEQPLDGGWASGDLAVDLGAAWAAAQATGSVAGRLGEVRLEVVAATSAADGSIDASAVQTFVLDGVSATPIPPEPVTGSVGSGGPGGNGIAEGEVAEGVVAGGVGPGGKGDDAGSAPSGSVAIDGALRASDAVPAEVSFGPLEVPRSLAWALVALAGGIVLVGGVASVAATARARRRGEASLLATRHRSSLVALHGAPALLGGPPSAVTSFGSLRRVADTVGQPIGVSADGDETSFWVTDGVRVWRYRVPTG